MRDTVAWLNAMRCAKGADAIAYRRVCNAMKLVEELIKLDTKRDYPTASLWPSGKAKATVEQRRDLTARRKVVDRLNRLFRQYATYPRAGFSPQQLNFHPEPVRAAQRSTIDCAIGSFRYRFGEADAIRGLLTLESSGGRQFGNPFGRCGRCGDWFIRRRQKHIYCGEDCRKDQYAQGPKFKGKRKRYMRKYRRQEAARNREALKQARA